MSCQSVDQLQKILTEKVFHYAKDSKKAAGRALGTLVEIITFYALKSWGLEKYVAIERPLPEFANDNITHNVEYSLHPSTPLTQVEFSRDDLPITARKIAKNRQIAAMGIAAGRVKTHALLTRDLILRNSCTIDELLLNPKRELVGAKDAFLTSYTGVKGVNQFTKVRVALAADASLQSYFRSRRKVIENWFNVIAPTGKRLVVLQQELETLKDKNWQDIQS